MSKSPRLDLTADVQLALEAVRRAEISYAPGGMSSSVIELPKLALADAVLAAVAAQQARQTTRRARLAQVRPRPAVVVEVRLTPKRSRRA